MNCNVFPMVITDLKWEDAIYPESGICPNGILPLSQILSFDLKCKLVQRWSRGCVRVSMRAWLELKAGVHSEREGVTHLILLLTFPSPGIFRCFYCQWKVQVTLLTLMSPVSFCFCFFVFGNRDYLTFRTLIMVLSTSALEVSKPHSFCK